MILGTKMVRKLIEFRESKDEPKPFLDHVEDFRSMLVKMVAVLGVAMILSFVFRSDLATIVQAPLHSVNPERAANLQSLGVADSMTISLQLAFYAGIILSFPFLLYFLAEFVVPALNAAEKRMLFPASALCFGLFLGGASFGYFVVLPQALDFFFQDAQAMHWQPTWTVREYYSFATQFVIAFGLAFELPLAVLLLVRFGFVDIPTLRRTRAFALVIIFVFAAIITPTQDVITLLLMGAPMYILYEGSIWLAGIFQRRDCR